MVHLAPSLVTLRAEINAAAPGREKASDGWIGDAAHCPGVSDHCADASGMVHALDVDKDFNSPHVTANRLVKLLIGDWRLAYIIWNRTIWSRSWGWTARVYTGSNPHTQHIHLSLRHVTTAEQSKGTWNVASLLPPPPRPDFPTPPPPRALVLGSSLENAMPYMLAKHESHPEVFALFASGAVRHIGPAEFEVYSAINDGVVLVPMALTTDDGEYERWKGAASVWV